MTAKLGSVYKVTKGDIVHVGMLLDKKKGWRDETIYYFLYMDGTEQNEYGSNVQLSSTRLRPEVREKFKTIHKMYKDKEKIVKKREELDNQIREHAMQLKKEREELKEVAGTFTVNDVARHFEEKADGYPYCYGNPATGRIQMSISNHIEKYARPDSYSFLEYEYDSTIYIADHYEAVKQYGIKISDAEMKKIKSPLKKLKFVTFEDSIDIGDKNTLSANKTIILQGPKKGLSASEVNELADELLEVWNRFKRYED